MALTIKHQSKINYPLKEEDLKIGQIYMGSDGLLYLAVTDKERKNIKCSCGWPVIAVEVNGIHYLTSEPTQPEEDITFREVEITLTIHD